MLKFCFFLTCLHFSRRCLLKTRSPCDLLIAAVDIQEWNHDYHFNKNKQKGGNMELVWPPGHLLASVFWSLRNGIINVKYSSSSTTMRRSWTLVFGGDVLRHWHHVGFAVCDLANKLTTMQIVFKDYYSIWSDNERYELGFNAGGNEDSASTSTTIWLLLQEV